MGQSVLLRAFSAGELDPGLSVRGDLDLYRTGLKTCRNFVVRRSGGVTSRPGLEHVAQCRDAYHTVLMTFIFPAADDSYVIEAGNFYFRFHHRTRGVVQELITPYPVGALWGTNRLTWQQSGLGIVLTHLGFPPYDLRYTAPDTFTLTPSLFGPVPIPPVDLAVVVGRPGTGTFHYKVTTVWETYEESVASEPVTLLLADTATIQQPHKLSWTAVPGAIEYKVYRADGDTNTFGYLGTATGQVTFDDVGLAMDYAFTPPIPRLPLFDSAFLYPATSAVHQQRRLYAGTHTFRDQFFASRIGLPWNFTHRSPMQDDDAITWRNVSADLQIVRHLVSLGHWLLVLTDRGEWIIRGDSDGGLTPSTIYPDQVGYVGASEARPAIYGDRLLFIESRDVSLREWVIDQRHEGLSGRDLTRLAAHLFRGQTIVAMAFSLIPDAVLWIVRGDGVLLGLTYVPDEDALAWHHHDTEGGLFEQVVVVPEPQEDAVYVVVNRDGVRHLERLGIRGEPTHMPALDRVTRFRGPATALLSGLAHLAGRTARVVADGRVVDRLVSAAGTVTLPTPASVVDVGLPITCDLETLDLDVGTSGVRVKRKKITSLTIEIENSLQNFFAGPDAAHLKPVTAGPWENATTPVTGRVELSPTGTFTDQGRVFLRHTAPTTLTVLGVFPTVDVGG